MAVAAVAVVDLGATVEEEVVAAAAAVAENNPGAPGWSLPSRTM